MADLLLSLVQRDPRQTEIFLVSLNESASKKEMSKNQWYGLKDGTGLGCMSELKLLSIILVS